MNGLKRLEAWKYSPVQLLPSPLEAAKVERIEVRGQQKLVTVHEGAGPFAHTALEIDLAEGASLEHVHVMSENADAVHIEEVQVNVARGACYTLNALSIGSKLCRSDVVIRLMGEGAECRLVGLDLGSGSSHCDRHLLIEHQATHTKSSQLFKGIFNGEASASFFGKIKVLAGADKSVAEQVNRNLLLSANAQVNTRPQLEIDTDDVACTHGATVGQLDENALFFLRSRGLSLHDARAMLTGAFAREVLSAFGQGAEEANMEARVQRWLLEELR